MKLTSNWQGSLKPHQRGRMASPSVLMTGLAAKCVLSPLLCQRLSAISLAHQDEYPL
jgi:hypothetical protein